MRAVYLILFLISTEAFGLEIKVLIAKSRPVVVLEGIDLKRYVVQSNSLRQYSGKKAIKFDCSKVTGSKKASHMAKVTSRTGFIEWEEKKYRGEIDLISNSDGGCHIVNRVSLESYLSSLLAKEMHSDWPLEALKAQAIAARTYAFFRIKKKGKDPLFHLESSQKDQVSGSFNDETISTAKAQHLTRGQILVHKSNSVTPTFYHSKCGGMTYTAKEVWGNRVKGITSVDCPYCHNHGTKNWKTEISKADFIRTFSSAVKRDQRFSLSFDNLVSENKTNIKAQTTDDKTVYLSNGRQGHYVLKPFIRRTFGRGKVKSNNFDIKTQDNKIIVQGTGLGHGVGLCQYGAYEMAKKGKSYKDILSHYFPNHKIGKLRKHL